MHFAKTDIQFRNSDEIIRYIKDNGYIPNYNKTDPKLFDKIKGNLSDAITNAQWLEARAKDNEYNPYTVVHKLVQLLQELATKNF